jgi:outer membrane protein assembly factor BamB
MKHKGRKMRCMGTFLTLLVLFALFPDFLSAAEGEATWRLSIGSGIDSSPAIGPTGNIYVGCLDNSLYAISSSGSLIWTFTTQGQIHSSPAVGSDGTIYVGSDDSNLYAINSDGTQKWVFSASSRSISSSPAISSDGILYVGSENGGLYAVNSDGSSASGNWPFSADSAITSSPAIASDGTLYFGSTGGILYAITSTGSLSWEFSDSNSIGSIYSSPAIDGDGTIYFGSNNASNSNVYAVNSDGTLKWSHAIGTSILSSPVIRSDGSVLIGSGNGIFYALSQTDGSEVWTYNRDDKAIPSSALVASDGNIYYGSNDEKVFALNSSGTLQWELMVTGLVSASPAMGFGGNIYVGTESGYLYAIETASSQLASGLWPSFHHDARHTGRTTSNTAPTANAGSDKTVKSEVTVTLNGSGSSDPDYGIPLFSWTQTDGDTVSLSDDTSVTPSFTAPTVSDDNKKTLTFQLKVTDNGGLTSTDTIVVTVEKNDESKRVLYQNPEELIA